MKKFSVFFLAAALIFTGCSNSDSNRKDKDSSNSGASTQKASSSTIAEIPEKSSDNSTNTSPSENKGSHVLIAYFTVPEDDVDTVAGASVVVEDGKKYGNTEYVANVIQQAIGGDLFRIEAVREYTHDHD